jgi:hypothetical protein
MGRRGLRERGAIRLRYTFATNSPQKSPAQGWALFSSRAQFLGLLLGIRHPRSGIAIVVELTRLNLFKRYSDILFPSAQEATHTYDQGLNLTRLSTSASFTCPILLLLGSNTSCLYQSVTVSAFCGMAVCTLAVSCAA